MDRLTRVIARAVIRNWKDTGNPRVRSRYGFLEGGVSIAVNLILSAIKLTLGISLRSTGLIADAVHSLSDMASSLVVILGFKISSKPPDLEHPFGHAKAEYIATLVVALLMIVAGVEIGQEGVWELIEPRSGEAYPVLTWGMLAILVGMIAAKEALSGFSRALGRMIGSETLIADAWHHRTDALSTGVVIAGLWGRNLGLPWLDGVAALVVSAWIVLTGFKLAFDAVSPLLGEMAPAAEIEEIRGIARSVGEVVSCHDIKVHKYGHFYFTTIHVELSDRLDVHKMHQAAAIIEMRILRRFPGECVVHMDPVNLHHPLLNRVSDVIKDVVVGHPELVEFRDLNLWSESGEEKGDVEISVDPETSPETYPTLSGIVEKEVRRQFPSLELSVRLKVDFSAEPLGT